MENLPTDEPAEDPEKIVVVYWHDPNTGERGRGLPVAESAALPVVRKAAELFPDIVHWLVPVKNGSAPPPPDFPQG